MVQYFIGFKLTHIFLAICMAAQFMTQLLDVLDFFFSFMRDVGIWSITGT